MACPSVLPVPGNKLFISLYIVGRDLIADTAFPAFASLCATLALIPFKLAHSSEHVMRTEVISCSKFPRITSQLTVTGQHACLQKYQTVNKSKHDISTCFGPAFMQTCILLYPQQIYDIIERKRICRK